MGVPATALVSAYPALTCLAPLVEGTSKFGFELVNYGKLTSRL